MDMVGLTRSPTWPNAGATLTLSSSISYSGLPQQNWYYTEDNHIAITGGTGCADVRKEDGTTFQVWGCSGTDPQQVGDAVLPPVQLRLLLSLNRAGVHHQPPKLSCQADNS